MQIPTPFFIIYSMVLKQKITSNLALFEFISAAIKNLKDKKQTDTLIINLTGAFQKVGHARPIKKLMVYRIAGKANEGSKPISRTDKSSCIGWSEIMRSRSVIRSPTRITAGPMSILFYINDLPDAGFHS